MDYKIIKVLDEKQIAEIKDNISNCTWVDGQNTWSGENTRKKNQQVNTSDQFYKKISSIIYSSLDSNRDFLNFTLASQSSPITLSKYTKGCYYNIHSDEAGPKYSTTIFLNDPSTYTGGELCLYINGKEEKFKLEPGYAITYNTGILHKVNKITKGERLCAIFWSYSKVKDEYLLDVYLDLLKLESLVKAKIPVKNDDYSTFESCRNSPSSLIEFIIEKIHRKLIN